jgi:hypothetical protein
VFSSNANSSPQIKREVERAVSRGTPIIPFRIEAVPLSKSLEYFISSPHWLDALSPPMEKHLQYLVDTVHMLLSRVVPQPSAPSPAQPLFNANAMPANEWRQPSAASEPAAQWQRSGPASGPIPQWQQQPRPAPVGSKRPSTDVDYKAPLIAVGLLMLFGLFAVVAFLVSPWGKPIRQWFTGGHPDTQHDQQSSTDEQTAIPLIRNLKVTIDYNVQEQGQIGLLYHLAFDIENAKKGDCAAVITYYSRDRRDPIPAQNNNYSTVDHILATYKHFTPADDQSTYRDLQLFMPYDEVSMQTGEHYYAYCVRLWYGQKPVSDCWWDEFRMTR